MGIDAKYGRVTTERGDIGEDEPVVVFRAQDNQSCRCWITMSRCARRPGHRSGT